MDGGVWRTIAGRRVYIEKGQSLTEAMQNSGKFKTQKNDIQSRLRKQFKKNEKEEFENYLIAREEFEELFNKNRDTARTEFYKQKGMDGKPKVIEASEFEKIKDNNNPVMQRSTTDKGYNDLINGEYRTSDLTNSMYGTGIYFAYGEDDKEYYSKLKNTQKVFEARMDKNSKMIDSRDLQNKIDKIKQKLGNDKTIKDNIILADNGLMACTLGYDGIYFDNVKYGLIINRGKLIIKK